MPINNLKIIYLPFLFLVLSSLLSAQKNRALLVGIDNYPPENGWSSIHATNDIRLMVPILKKVGYKEENIYILKNEEAIRNTIVDKLEKLVKISDKGDYIYIHFSCHGQQMADNNGDEPDGLDEAMIPYDAPRRYIKGIYEGENHLRDDLLGELFNAIRYKIGAKGNMLVVFDACHSGTADRDTEDETYIRGTTYIFAPKDFKTPLTISPNAVFNPFYHEGMAHITIISACGPNERNYEYKDPESGEYYGSLSYSFVKTLGNFQKENPNTDFFNKLHENMNEISQKRRRVQTPFIETTDNNGIFKIARDE